MFKLYIDENNSIIKQEKIQYKEIIVEGFSDDDVLIIEDGIVIRIQDSKNKTKKIKEIKNIKNKTLQEEAELKFLLK